ncbi:MAG: hypothetical protein ACW98F_11020, partial [Candidatus Hodarchaeales archaeon]
MNLNKAMTKFFFLSLFFLVISSSVTPLPRYSSNEEGFTEVLSLKKSESDTPASVSSKQTVETQDELSTKPPINLSQEGTVELMGSRGQTYRHFKYPNITNRYLYQSDILVQKSEIVEGSNWVTFEEYPLEFVVYLLNGSVIFFDTSDTVTQFIRSIDSSELWGVGLETYAGIMGFYLNFADLENGHGQYMYWPRLSDGTLTPYNMPLYNIFPQLYTKRNGNWEDQLLIDRALYLSPTQDPRNTLEFFVTGNQIGIQFLTPNVRIQRSTWDFVHGFKFDLSDGLYHMITTLECHDQDFEDIGMTYEVLSSPQADGTPYQTDHFQLVNQTHEISIGTTQAWEAAEFLNNYSSNILVVSENNEAFRFAFDDMEDVGFTSKHLQLHEMQFPDGTKRKTLHIGMFKYGKLLAGERIEIDPVLEYTSDNYDLYRESSTYT